MYLFLTYILCNFISILCTNKALLIPFLDKHLKRNLGLFPSSFMPSLETSGSSGNRDEAKGGAMAWTLPPIPKLFFKLSLS